MDQLQRFDQMDDGSLPDRAEVDRAFDWLAASDPTVHSLLTRCLVAGQHDATYQARLLCVILGRQVAELNRELAELA